MPEVSEAALMNREVFLKVLVPRQRRGLWVTSRMAEVMVDVHVRAGDVLFDAGTPAEHYYFVVNGEVEMVRPGAPSWTVTGPGLVGAIDIGLGRAHARAAVAKTDADILRLEAAVWFDAMEDSFDLALAVFLNMARAAHALRMRPPPQGGFDRPPDDARPVALPSVVDRILFMRDVPLFGSASTQALTSLAETTEVVTLDEGALLFDGTDSTGRIYVVASGEIEAVHEASSVTARFRAGGLVAGAAAFAPQNGGFVARATAPAALLAVDFDDYCDIMEEHFSLVRAALRFMAADFDLLLERQSTPPGVAVP